MRVWDCRLPVQQWTDKPHQTHPAQSYLNTALRCLHYFLGTKFLMTSLPLKSRLVLLWVPKGWAFLVCHAESNGHLGRCSHGSNFHTGREDDKESHWRREKRRGFNCPWVCLSFYKSFTSLLRHVLGKPDNAQSLNSVALPLGDACSSSQVDLSFFCNPFGSHITQDRIFSCQHLCFLFQLWAW